MTVQELFIANLKDYRKSRGISQLKLAELCDSSQAYIAAIEVGKKAPSFEMIERIALALGIESYHLFQNVSARAAVQGWALTPLQKQEMAEKIHSAVAKIIKQY
jgi:transcriptional regulator with XRE-family HTH domain